MHSLSCIGKLPTARGASVGEAEGTESEASLRGYWGLGFRVLGLGLWVLGFWVWGFGV